MCIPAPAQESDESEQVDDSDLYSPVEADEEVEEDSCGTY